MMQSASELLVFRSDFFKKDLLDRYLTIAGKHIEASTEKLDVVTRKLGEGGFNFKSQTIIPELFKRFLRAFGEQRLSSEFTKNELRKLSFGLSYSDAGRAAIFENETQLEAVLELFDEKWTDSYLYGMLDCLMSNWKSNKLASLSILRKAIVGRLTVYTGRGKVFCELKNNLFLLERSGPANVGALLAQRGGNLTEIPALMFLPDAWICKPYFSKAILVYYEKRKNQLASDLDQYEQILNTHRWEITSKRLISKLIIQADETVFSEFQQRIKVLALHVIGDPVIAAKWAPFEGATAEEKEEIANAFRIINKWIIRQFITVFFEKCVNDPRRKRYWLKHATKVDVFKVIGPQVYKNALRMDDRVSDLIDGRYQTTHSSSKVAAIMMAMGDYIIVEFSDPGYAFYAYRKDNQLAPNFIRKYYSVDALRNSALPQLVYRSGYSITKMNPEGRMPHNDGDRSWEEIFDQWMLKYIRR